jgi:hypothetical protein
MRLIGRATSSKGGLGWIGHNIRRPASVRALSETGRTFAEGVVVAKGARQPSGLLDAQRRDRAVAWIERRIVAALVA